MSIRHPTHNGAERRDRVMQIIGAGILLVLVGILIVMVARSERETEATATRAQDLASQVRQACEAGGDTAKELGSACKQARQIEATPVVGEQGEPGPSGPPGPPGPPPSKAQVKAAVLAYCADGRCRGSGPTNAEVKAAVKAYCDDRGKCRGPQGDTGQQGPPPSDEQVNAAVNNYCAARNDCRGPAGPQGAKGDKGDPGEDGADGKDGRGIKSVECREDGTWLITYTDGTTQEADGPCRARPIASP